MEITRVETGADTRRRDTMPMADQHPRYPIFARLWEHVIAPMATRRGAGEHRRELLEDLAGRVIEVGAGQGANFPFYPPSVERVVAIEPENHLRRRAEQAATSAPIPVSVLDGTAEHLPGEDGSFDAGVVSLVLCTVPDQERALGELFRVIKPGGELRFYEHVISRRAPYAYIQRFEEATFWPWLLGAATRPATRALP